MAATTGITPKPKTGAEKEEHRKMLERKRKRKERANWSHQKRAAVNAKAREMYHQKKDKQQSGSSDTGNGKCAKLRQQGQPGAVCAVLDFAENYRCQSQDEAQSTY
ncbi:hypothetical protein ElyMa_000986900 [Elysia marginata]|uniref:Uncharacterized protein n=1 Tax=Elysia marginata TaxID=1093978 RepID=A0AAV4HHY2_9GAST|nr:hypothetical protein ElyMa_000986900 [Elysia marginata]